MSSLLKKCPKCNEVKPIGRFSRNHTRKDGLQDKCKDCCNEYYRRYRKENLEAERERSRRHWKENLEAERERKHRRSKNYRSVSKEVAGRTGEPWTEAEDAFVKTSDLSDLEVAVELGRTYNSVTSRRHRLRKLQQT